MEQSVMTENRSVAAWGWEWIARGYQEIWGDDINVCYPDCSDGFMGMLIHQK